MENVESEHQIIFAYPTVNEISRIHSEATKNIVNSQLPPEIRHILTTIP